MEKKTNSITCNVCGQLLEETAKSNQTNSKLFEVKDFKYLNTESIGFPTGSTHQRQAWKIKLLQSVDTYICDKCIAISEQKNEEESIIIKKKSKPKAIILILVSILLVFSLFRVSFDINPTLFALDLILSLIILGITAYWIDRAFRKQNFFSHPSLSIHVQKCQQIAKSIENFKEYNGDLYTEIGDYPKKLNSKFFMRGNDWETISSNVKLFEEKTGWSIFHDFSTHGTSSLNLDACSEKGEFNSTSRMITDYTEFTDKFNKRAVRE